MKRSEIKPIPAYFEKYINLCQDVQYYDAIQQSIHDLRIIPIADWDKLGHSVYAPDKWTVKEILQHIIDTERVFMFRALVFARGESQKVISFDENAYASVSEANRRSVLELIEELQHTHDSLMRLFRSFTNQMLTRMCVVSNGEYPVAAIPFILLGHQRSHINVIKEKYHPLLED
ncbi:MAG: DinB family protein [Saprospiraceae bacterium]